MTRCELRRGQRGHDVGLAFMVSSSAGTWIAVIGACVLATASSVIFRGKRRSQS